jgi:GNAT superfamily N-acetyltransferase
MPIEIVVLTPERVDEAKHFVEGIWKEHFSSHPDPFVRSFLSQEKLSDIDDFQSEYVNSDGIFLLVLETGTIVGTGAIRRVNTALCELTRMFVKRSHRRSGLGTRLAAELLAWARKCGYHRVRLTSNKRLLASHRVYAKLGFQLVRSWDPDGDAHSLYFMKDL